MVRIKERYLLVNILYPPNPAKPTEAAVPDSVVQHQPTIEKLTPAALLKAIKTEVAVLFGDYGSGALEAHLSVKYLSLATSTFILRCAREHQKLLWAALFFIDRVPVQDGRPCMLRVVRVSGTMRKAEEEAIRQARQLIMSARQQASLSLAPVPMAAANSASARTADTNHDARESPELDALDDVAMDQDDG